MQDISVMACPLVLYHNHREWSADDLAKLREKSHGIRVFYFNPSNKHCDHPHQWEEQEEWQSKPRESLEAGTVIDLNEYQSRGVLQPLVVIQWDCGFQKVYTELEMNCLRVFDLGPTGVLL